MRDIDFNPWPQTRRQTESNTMNTLTRCFITLSAALALCISPALAHTEAPHTNKAKKAGPVQKEQKPWGIAGEAKQAQRTVTVRMVDYMRFSPDQLEFRQGETVRFVIDNDDLELHEFVLGTQDEIDSHAALMKKFPNMEHDDPWMAHVSAGGRGEIVWTFNRPGEFVFACLMPRHFEAGMVGKIKVVSSKVK